MKGCLGALTLLIVAPIAFIVFLYALGSAARGNMTPEEIAAEEKRQSEYAEAKALRDNYESKITILPGWKYELERDYSYVRGRLRNDGPLTIRYWKVTAKYFSKKGEMIDQDYTNSGEELKPGEADSFEIMHRNRREHESARVEVTEVRLK